MAIIGGGGGGGGSGALARLFDSTVTGSAAASIDTGANGVPQATSHLLIICYLRGDTAATAVAANLTFNGDTAAHYGQQNLGANTTSVSASFTANTANVGASVPAASATANKFGVVEWLIPAYVQTTGHKAMAVTAGFADPTGSQFAGLRGGDWQSTAAITRVAITPAAGNFVIGSRMTIYGLL